METIITYGGPEEDNFYWRIVQSDNAGRFISFTCWIGDVDDLENDPDYIVIEHSHNLNPEWLNIPNQIHQQFEFTGGSYRIRPLTPQQAEQYIRQLLPS